MNKNIFSDISNFDMTNNSIFTQISQNDEMFGGNVNTDSQLNTISEFNLDELLENDTPIQYGGNDEYTLSSLSGIFSSSSNEGNIDSDLFTPISSFKLTDTTNSEQSSDILSSIGDISDL